MPTGRLWKRRALWMAAKLPYLWAILALAAVTVSVLFWAHPKQEVGIRWWGGALQLFGIVMVWLDLRGAQELFGQDGIRERIRKTLKTWPTAGATAHGTDGLTVTAALVGGRLKTRQPLNPAASVDARLEVLETNLAHIDKDLDNAYAATEKEARDRETADAVESRARRAADDKLRADMVEQATGSYSFSMFGVVWLLVGLVLSTGSQELARWFGR